MRHDTGPALYLAPPLREGEERDGKGGRIISAVLGVKEGMTFAESSVPIPVFGNAVLTYSDP